jgi:hypothetical protein
MVGLLILPLTHKLIWNSHSCMTSQVSRQRRGTLSNTYGAAKLMNWNRRDRQDIIRALPVRLIFKQVSQVVETYVAKFKVKSHDFCMSFHTSRATINVQLSCFCWRQGCIRCVACWFREWDLVSFQASDKLLSLAGCEPVARQVCAIAGA